MPAAANRLRPTVSQSGFGSHSSMMIAPVLASVLAGGSQVTQGSVYTGRWFNRSWWRRWHSWNANPTAMPLNNTGHMGEPFCDEVFGGLLLACGWERARYRCARRRYDTTMLDFNTEKHYRFSRLLVEQGWTFRRETVNDRDAADRLVSDSIGPSAVGPDQEGIVAVAPNGRIGGVIRYQALYFPKGVRVFLRAVAVVGEYRRQGIATVLINLFGTVLRAHGNPVAIGNCEQRMRLLYEDCGYRVLPPGMPFVDPVLGVLYCSDQKFDCWFANA